MGLCSVLAAPRPANKEPKEALETLPGFVVLAIHSTLENSTWINFTLINHCTQHTLATRQQGYSSPVLISRRVSPILPENKTTFSHRRTTTGNGLTTLARFSVERTASNRIGRWPLRDTRHLRMGSLDKNITLIPRRRSSGRSFRHRILDSKRTRGHNLCFAFDF
jgi:hypothetical protein